MYCRACEHSIERCPNCQETLRWSTEKGVDTAIVTGLLSLAGEGAFDAAMLVSSDTDYLPAVEWLQSRGFKVINATWANHGHELARACWASFELDAIVSKLRQSGGERAGAPASDRGRRTVGRGTGRGPARRRGGEVTGTRPYSRGD